ncbi:type II toxin-antitoxin system RelE/ParE family toxin [Enorma massiliensis]|nr:type II toxin-antitoxin system RelE/ParE family toxin [Enorma massiliensis]
MSPAMYSVSYLPTARQDFEDIARYITLALDNPEAATRAIEGIIAAAESLANMPYRRPVYVPVRPLAREYRTIRSGHYVAFYWVEEDAQRVTIARVLFARANVSERLAIAEQEL